MIPIDALSKLHKRQHNIRNICILAHVDHGKTTLADTLIASNGIISEKSAGQVRYMDNREDEQHRLITMKSSAISLAYKEKNPRKVDPEHGPLYLINLIDSPGHVDFTSEVSTAVRVSDGAIIVVDVVDGVGVQTKTVIRQMWKEHLSPILVLNKVDRLITHRKMTAVQAFLHLGKILEQINVILASFLKQDQFQNAQTSDVNPQTSPKPLDQSSLDQSSADQSDPSSLLTTDDWVVNMKDDRMERYFAPERDNVVFASAADRWGFRLSDFSRIYAERFGLKPLMLRKALWGDHYLKATKNEAGEVVHRIVANPSKATSVPLFVELVLRPIWEVYRNAIVKFDAKRLEGIIKTLAVKVLPRDLVPDGDHRNLLRSILSQWLPLSPAVLGTVIDHVPSPIAAQARRVPKLFRPLNPAADISPQLLEHHQALMRAMTACDPSSPDIVVFIAKVFDAGEKPVYHRSLSDAAASNDKEAVAVVVDENPNRSNFVAFARIFCGTLRTGSKVYVLGPKFDPQLDLSKHASPFCIDNLYILMGRDVVSIPEIQAGNVFGIGGIEEHVLKTATLCTTPLCTTFCEMPLLTAPIVRVAVEAENLLQRPRFSNALRLLNQSDPCVDVLMQPSGECLIVAAGEVHLQRCLHDLRKSLCPGLQFRVSSPLVAFRETITKAKARGVSSLAVRIKTPDQRVEIEISAEPLPDVILQCLVVHESTIKLQSRATRGSNSEAISAFHQRLSRAFDQAGKRWKGRFAQIWAVGPRRGGTNLFVNASSCLRSKSLWSNYHLAHPESEIVSSSSSSSSSSSPSSTQEGIPDETFMQSIMESICNGFELSTASGPLCEEQMTGVCFILSEVTCTGLDNSSLGTSLETPSSSETSVPATEVQVETVEQLPSSGCHYFGPLTGQVISAANEACRLAFLNHSVRLVEPMYSCALEVEEDQLGLVYACLGRRRAQILRDEMREGSNIFEVEALLPVAESFGFADELLSQARGAASIPSLVFSGWRILPEDPFFVPETEEELEEFGTNYRYLKNKAAELIQAVRRRKGLWINEKLVETAEKQRTLAKKK